MYVSEGNLLFSNFLIANMRSYKTQLSLLQVYSTLISEITLLCQIASHPTKKPPKNPPQPCHNRHRRHCLSSFSRFLVDFEQTLNFFIWISTLLVMILIEFLSRFKTNFELVVLFWKIPSALLNRIAFFI